MKLRMRDTRPIYLCSQVREGHTWCVSTVTQPTCKQFKTIECFTWEPIVSGVHHGAISPQYSCRLSLSFTARAFVQAKHRGQALYRIYEHAQRQTLDKRISPALQVHLSMLSSDNCNKTCIQLYVLYIMIVRTNEQSHHLRLNRSYYAAVVPFEQ